MAASFSVSSQVVCNFALLGEIPDTDDEPDDHVARIPNVAEGNGSGEFGTVLWRWNALTGPERLIGGYDDLVLSPVARGGSKQRRNRPTDKPTTSKGS